MRIVHFNCMIIEVKLEVFGYILILCNKQQVMIIKCINGSDKPFITGNYENLRLL